MVDRIVLLSWRVGATAANIAIGTAVRGAGLALTVARAVVPFEKNGSPSATEDVFDGTAEPMDDETRPTPATGGEPVGQPEPSDQTEPAERRETVGGVIDYDAEPPTPLDPSATAAKTIDDEPELVAEFAEPGAEDGATAEIEIDEPWDGYDDLSADEAVARIEQAGPAEIAVLELYEQANKNRRTVLVAAEARLRALENAPG